MELLMGPFSQTKSIIFMQFNFPKQSEGGPTLLETIIGPENRPKPERKLYIPTIIS